MVADPSYNPKASVFDELGVRLKNQLFLQTAPLKSLSTDSILHLIWQGRIH